MEESKYKIVNRKVSEVIFNTFYTIHPEKSESQDLCQHN